MLPLLLESESRVPTNGALGVLDIQGRQVLLVHGSEPTPDTPPVSHPRASVRLENMPPDDCSFPAGDDACAAWMYPALGGRDTTAIVVMAHGLSGTRRDRLGAFAERFAAAGMAALL